MTQLFMLFEHAAGLALFTSSEFEELGVLASQVARTLGDLAKFRSLFQLVAFTPHESSRDAIDVACGLADGVLPAQVQLFLETNMPQKKKKKKRQAFVLGVADPKIALAISETLEIQCQSTGAIPEIMRYLRLHFAHMVSSVESANLTQAQVALGLNYSRSRVKFNIQRVDKMIIHSITLLDQLDKDLNTFTMRIREWYSYHFPELAKLVTDNSSYARAVSIIKDRSNMDENVAEQLEEVLKDADKVKTILELAKCSMGMEISEIDLKNIELFCARVISLSECRHNMAEYLKEKMDTVAPNLAELIGDFVGARLISHAGSLMSLAKFPASTVQILGAEKALFRALKTRGNTPKYGLIFHSTFIGRAEKKDKGRISRFLANKCSIASRIDCFSDAQTSLFGKRMKQQVEDRLKFLGGGEIPAKNIEVMAQAVVDFETEKCELKKKRKKDKKKKKREREAMEKADHVENGVADVQEESMIDQVEDHEEPPKKKKKKKRNSEEVINVEEQPAEIIEIGSSPIKKKKRKHKELA